MRNWVWLFPCWVRKYFFAQFPTERMLLDGRIKTPPSGFKAAKG
jgi:hypothetical protein